MDAVAVITATVGRPSLRACSESVVRNGAHHFVVVDGPEHEAEARKHLGGITDVTVMVLPDNVGSHSWNGHRVYAALPHILPPRFLWVAFLDDDNEYIGSSLSVMHGRVTAESLDWCFCRRRVTDGATDTEDLCESLGPVPRWERIADYILIDVNCYLLKRSVACALGSLWNRPYKLTSSEIDRDICKTLVRDHPVFGILEAPGVLYKTDSSPSSVSIDFFTHGNQQLPAPPEKPQLYVFHFTPDATARYLAQPVRGKRSHSPAYQEWCMTLLDGLVGTYDLVNGYAAEVVPTGSKCLFCICQPEHLPDSVLLRRDITKIGYLFESPNVRHQAQNDAGFLLERFDVVMTYWHDLINLLPESRVLPCMQFCHCIDLHDPWDRALLQQNEDTGRSVCIVLENRDLKGRYVVNETALECLDHLRLMLAQAIGKELDVVGYGPSWAQVPKVRRGVEGPWVRSAGHNIMLLKRHAFSLIVENCSAAGYVSEKIMDAWVAGCIPLYYGNLDKSQLQVPEDMYIDLRTTPDVGALIASLGEDTLNALKRRIMTRREEILEANSPARFAEKVDEALSMAGELPPPAAAELSVATPVTVRVRIPGVGPELEALCNAFKSKSTWIGCSSVRFGAPVGSSVSPESTGWTIALWNFFIRQFNMRFGTVWSYRDLLESGIMDPNSKTVHTTARVFGKMMPFVIDMALLKFDGDKVLGDGTWVIVSMCQAFL